MSLYDLIVRNARVVTSTGVRPADVAVSEGRIAELAPEIEGTSREEIDASGLHLFPGLIDAHVHFNEPGRTTWEGFESGTRALAAGGATAFFDMPLNSNPPTIDAASFDLKREAAEKSSLIDFGLWGGLVPGNVDRLDEMVARGAIGFKAFMSASGIPEFQAVDDLTLYEGMARAAKLGTILALHAENDSITLQLTRRAAESGDTGARDFLRSRPVVAELEAIERAILLAGETGCRIHIVHVSSGRGVALVEQARKRGVDVSCETCPHYLVLSEEDLETLGAVAKCAPPLRSRAEQDLLWKQLLEGDLRIVASDHSPSPASMKAGGNFFQAWGGISGCQSMLSLLITEGYAARNLSLETIAAVTSENVAARFGIRPKKGVLSPGADADLTLVELEGSFVLESAGLFYRHRHSPYEGRTMTGRVVRTLVRGTTVFLDGRVVSGPKGRLISPS